MRYFTIKPDFEAEEPFNKQTIVISYKRFFTELICADTQISTEHFLRLNSLFAKFNKLEEGNVLEIEDQDYNIIRNQKLEAYIKSARGITIAIPHFAEFVKEIQNMPTDNPSKEENPNGKEKKEKNKPGEVKKNPA